MHCLFAAAPVEVSIKAIVTEDDVDEDAGEAGSADSEFEDDLYVDESKFALFRRRGPVNPEDRILDASSEDGSDAKDGMIRSLVVWKSAFTSCGSMLCMPCPSQLALVFL